MYFLLHDFRWRTGRQIIHKLYQALPNSICSLHLRESSFHFFSVVTKYFNLAKISKDYYLLFYFCSVYCGRDTYRLFSELFCFFFSLASLLETNERSVCFFNFVCFTLQIKYQRHRTQRAMSNSVSIHHGFVGFLMDYYKGKLSRNDFFSSSCTSFAGPTIHHKI